MRYRTSIFSAVLLLSLAVSFALAPRAAQTARTITVITEPNAIVWIDDIRRGTTDESGKLTIKPVAAGIRKLRVRADGFKEISQNLTAAQKGDVKVTMAKTTDQAELSFQQAEKMATEDREKSVELYEKAAKLRPKYAEAYLGMARVLSDQGNSDDALEAIKKARRARPIYPEASAVEGRIYKDAGEEEKAIASFKRAIREGKGVQPEAYTGLGLLYKEKAGGGGASGDFATEEANYQEAIKNLQKAIEQLSASEPVVYILLGEIYEKLNKDKEAILVYEQFLRDFPVSDDRTAVESFIVQLKKKMAGQ
jgi:tetratricopeptide (TPR) repeat protein